MINLKLSYDQRRIKKDGTHPLVFRITLNGQSRDISTGFSCKPSAWDVKRHKIKPNSPELKLIQQRIKDQELDLLGKLREIEFTSPAISSVREVKILLNPHKSKVAIVLSFWLDEIKRQEKAKKFGNARNYNSVLMGIQHYKSLKVSFKDINYSWLIDLEGDQDQLLGTRHIF